MLIAWLQTLEGIRSVVDKCGFRYKHCCTRDLAALTMHDRCAEALNADEDSSLHHRMTALEKEVNQLPQQTYVVLLRAGRTGCGCAQ